MSELIIPSSAEVRRYARGALAAAGALDVAPVPIDDVVTSVGLHKEDLFSLGEENLPPRILALARKFSGRILGAMAIKEKVLYVDETLSSPRRRFTKAHEVGHQALPWHEDAYYVDSKTSLRPDTRDLLEQEANAFAAEVMFGLDRFTEEADSYAPGLAAAFAVAERFEASGHAALRRYAATSGHPVALLVFGQYLEHNGAALKLFPAQCASSRSFTARYGEVTSLVGGTYVFTAGYPALGALATQTTQLQGQTFEMRLDTKRGLVTFRAHLFFNRRLRFVLLTRKAVLGRRVRVVDQESVSA